MHTTSIPGEILDSYDIGIPSRLQLLGGGAVNTTFLLQATHTDEAVILQRLNPVLPAAQTRDYEVIREHLEGRDWLLPSVVPNTDSNLTTLDRAGSRWRVMEYLENDRSGEKLYPYSAARIGGLLGKLHTDLSSLDYQPASEIPHFHDIDYYTQKLEAAFPELPEIGKRLAATALELQLDQAPINDDYRQLIHADPKTDNILFRTRMPFTFIDWDTAMQGSPLLDVGDAIRSALKHIHSPLWRYTSPEQVVRSMTSAYRLESEHPYSHEACVSAAATIALELTVRYLEDCAPSDEGYFSWDASKFSSRVASNTYKAADSLERFRLLQEIMQ